MIQGPAEDARSRRGVPNPLQPILDALRQGADPKVPAGMTVEVLTVLSVPKSQQPTPAVGNTYALLIGISQYQKSPNLKYAATDAATVGSFLTSPRGGVPASNVRVLLDKQATAAAVRASFQGHSQTGYEERHGHHLSRRQCTDSGYSKVGVLLPGARL
jgi:hypothetical protein